MCTRRSKLGEPLMAFETDQDGKAQLAFPRSLVPEPTEGKPQWLWLRSQGVGLLTRTSFKALPKDDGVTLKLNIVVQPGTLLEGRILGPDGRPAAGQVEWWYFGDEGITRSLVGVARSDGLFRGELRRAGRHGLLASGTSRAGDDGVSYYMPEQLDLGTGFSELFDVDFAEAATACARRTGTTRLPATHTC
jgi:hypothetical protein